MMMQEDGSEIQEAKPAPLLDQQGQPVTDPHTLQPVMGYDGRLKKTEKKQLIKVESFSPEDLLIDREWTSPLLADCPYVCRLMRVTLSELKLMGFDAEPEDLRGSDGGETERLSEINKLESSLLDEQSNDDSMAQGWLRIEFILADLDGDGIAERVCVHRLQDKILKTETVSHVPIATFSPILNTHRWDGMSLDDTVGDLQKLNTDLLRQTLDNLKLTNNPRTKVLTDSNWTPLANLDDLLDSRIGGIIRMRDPNAVVEQVTPFAAAASMPMLEYVQQMRENRTGVSRTSQGLNPDSLNNTATGRQIDQTASQQRVELIARIAAETLLKPIFQGILKLLTDGGMEKLAFRLRDEFVEYDPNEWRDSYDMTINVGLGTGDKQQQGQSLMQIWQMQQAALPMGMATPQHLYHTAAKTIENAGFKDVQNFLQDPAKQPPQPPPPPPLPLQIEQMKQQADAQRFQAESQQDAQRFQAESQQTLQLEQIKAQAQLQATKATLELQRANDERDSARETLKAQYDMQLKQQEMQFEQWKANLQAKTQKELKELEIAGKIQIAQIGAQQAITLSDMAATQGAANELTQEFNDEA